MTIPFILNATDIETIGQTLPADSTWKPQKGSENARQGFLEIPDEWQDYELIWKDL